MTLGQVATGLGELNATRLWQSCCRPCLRTWSRWSKHTTRAAKAGCRKAADPRFLRDGSPTTKDPLDRIAPLRLVMKF